jgi:hypothetical protein
MMTRTPRRIQPCCGKAVDAATDMEGKQYRPKEGDFCLCIYCGAWCRYVDADLNMRVFDAEDILDLTDEQREKMRRATAIIHQMQHEKPPEKPPLTRDVRRRPRR